MSWRALAYATTALTMAALLPRPLGAAEAGLNRATAQARFTALKRAGIPPTHLALKPLSGKRWGVVLHLNGDNRLLMHEGALALVQLLPAPAPLALRPRTRTSPPALPVLDGKPVLSSLYGLRQHPFTGALDFHQGIDIAAPAGTAVRPAGWGVVRFAGPNGGYGNMVEVEHPGGLVTRYGHLSEIGVRLGQVVGNRALLGRVGATGRATAPHLHFETRLGGRPVDPRAIMPWLALPSRRTASGWPCAAPERL
jgi:murein DD-endopeptidase MepM/ murein hydrolase activator NlpD